RGERGVPRDSRKPRPADSRRALRRPVCRRRRFRGIRGVGRARVARIESLRPRLPERHGGAGRACRGLRRSRARAARTARTRLRRARGAGARVWAPRLWLVAPCPTVTGGVIMMVLRGVGTPLAHINGFTITQRIAPAETMSRVFGALESALIGGMAVGALLMP